MERSFLKRVGDTLFLKQIKREKILQLHTQNDQIPNVIVKSNRLVMYALQNSKNGEIFIHKAKSSYVLDIAKACLKLQNQRIKSKL